MQYFKLQNYDYQYQNEGNECTGDSQTALENICWYEIWMRFLYNYKDMMHRTSVSPTKGSSAMLFNIYQSDGSECTHNSYKFVYGILTLFLQNFREMMHRTRNIIMTYL